MRTFHILTLQYCNVDSIELSGKRNLPPNLTMMNVIALYCSVCHTYWVAWYCNNILFWFKSENSVPVFVFQPVGIAIQVSANSCVPTGMTKKYPDLKLRAGSLGNFKHHTCCDFRKEVLREANGSWILSEGDSVRTGFQSKFFLHWFNSPLGSLILLQFFMLIFIVFIAELAAGVWAYTQRQKVTYSVSFTRCFHIWFSL